MLRKGHVLVISVIAVSMITVLSVNAQQDLTIPEWVKNNALWWGQGDISDSDFIGAINFLIEQDYISSPSSPDLEKEKERSQKLQSKINKLENEIVRLEDKIFEYEAELRMLGGSDSSKTEKYSPPCYANQESYDQEFSAGPFRFKITEAGTDCFDEDGVTTKYFTVSLEATNKRGTSVAYMPTSISLTTSEGYALQHEYTNGLKVDTIVPSGGELSGFYTFENPDSSYGPLTLFIEVLIPEDCTTSYTCYYSGETTFYR